MASLQVLALSLGITAVILFGVAAVSFSWYKQWKQGHADSAEFFLTARHSVGAFTIAWAFYAGAMGSWALFGPPSYCLTAGLLGLIMYAVSSGIPILIIGLLGGVVHRLAPDVISFADFVNRRFGLVVSIYVSLIMLFNMGIALTAEFTAVGSLFQMVIGVSPVPIVVTIGVVSIIYTAIGGLFVSIITDQWQAVCSIIFILILVIYVAVTFRTPLGPLPDTLGWGNYYGLASIAVMPISLTTATLFSEAMWQRCWATSTPKALILGSLAGSILVICAVFIFGFGGVLAIWGNVWVPSGPDDSGNTILFSLFNGQTWVLVIVTLLSVTMSESAVDSLQNAIVDSIASLLRTTAVSLSGSFPSLAHPLSFVRDLNMWWIRFLVLALNVVPIVVSLQGYNVLQLFLLANLITTTSAVPIISGLWQGRGSRVLCTPFSVMFGCFCGLSSLFWWTAIQANSAGVPYTDQLYITFFMSYDWPPFLISLGMSMAGQLLGAALEFLARLILKRRDYPQYPLGTEEEIAEARKGDEEGKLTDAPILTKGAEEGKLVDATMLT